MKMCWNVEPTDRPTFSKISQMIERLLGEQSEREQVSWCEAHFRDSKPALPKRSIEQIMWRPSVLRKHSFLNSILSEIKLNCETNSNS